MDTGLSFSNFALKVAVGPQAVVVTRKWALFGRRDTIPLRSIVDVEASFGVLTVSTIDGKRRRLALYGAAQDAREAILARLPK